MRNAFIKTISSVIAAVLCTNCAYGGIFANFYPTVDTPTPSERHVRAEAIDGWTYCRNIEQHAARSSNVWTAEGIVFLGAGLAGSVAGTKMMTEGKATFTDFAVLGGSLVSLGIGVYGLQRSSSAAKASSTASLGLASNSSDAAFAICMAARSQWVSERQAANAQAQMKMIEYAERAFGSPDSSASPKDGACPDGGVCLPTLECDGGSCAQVQECDGGDCAQERECDGGNCM